MTKPVPASRRRWPGVAGIAAGAVAPLTFRTGQMRDSVPLRNGAGGSGQAGLARAAARGGKAPASVRSNRSGVTAMRLAAMAAASLSSPFGPGPRRNCSQW